MQKKVLTWKATEEEVLDYIKTKETVSLYDLVKEFNYSYKGAVDRLWKLKKEGLAVDIFRGVYTLTDKGREKLLYLKGRQR